MQRRARELLVRVKALRDQSERLASMDLRLQANRIASAGVDMSKLSEEEIPIAKQKKQRRRKKRLPKTEEQKGTPVQRKAWGSGPGGEPVNTHKYKAKEWKPPTGVKNIKLHVESEVLRAKREYRKDPGYIQAGGVQGEESVWWYVGGKGFFPNEQNCAAERPSSSFVEEEDVGAEAEEAKKENSMELIDSDSKPSLSEESSEKVDTLDLENFARNNNGSTLGITMNGTERPNFKLHHSKREKVFLLQEFSQQWLNLGARNISEKVKVFRDAIALRNKET